MLEVQKDKGFLYLVVWDKRKFTDTNHYNAVFDNPPLEMGYIFIQC